MKVRIFGIFAACSVLGLPASWAEDTPYVTLRSLTASLATRLALAAYEDCTKELSKNNFPI